FCLFHGLDDTMELFLEIPGIVNVALSQIVPQPPGSCQLNACVSRCGGRGKSDCCEPARDFPLDIRRKIGKEDMVCESQSPAFQRLAFGEIDTEGGSREEDQLRRRALLFDL